MKKLLLGLLVLGVLIGCGNKTTASKDSLTGEKTKLIVSTWGLSEDIIVDEVYAPFEEEYNCEIVLEIGTTAERYTKFANDPNSSIDVIDLSQSKAAEGYEKGLFEKLDYAAIPNASNLIPAAKKLTESGFGPAYTVNSIGIIYDKEAVGYEITSFSDLWNADLANKISIPEITTTFGPAMMYVASEYKGVNIESDNGQAAFDALESLKPNIVKTYSKSSDLANMFASGEIVVAVVGDFAIPIIQGAAAQVNYVVPKTGTYANFNTIDINVNSKNKELAYKFINWRISNELQSKTAISLNEAPTNATVVLSDEQAVNKTYGEIANTVKSINYEFVNGQLATWIDTWNRTLNR